MLLYKILANHVVILNESLFDFYQLILKRIINLNLIVMEPKKVKKLTLSKETIANLTNVEMSHQKGGSWFFCDSGLQLDCIWSAVAMGGCSAATGCEACLPTHNGGGATGCGYVGGGGGGGGVGGL